MGKTQDGKELRDTLKKKKKKKQTSLLFVKRDTEKEENKGKRKKKRKRSGGKTVAASSNWNALKGKIAPANPKFRGGAKRGRKNDKQAEEKNGASFARGQKRMRCENSTVMSDADAGVLLGKLKAYPAFSGQDNIFALDCEMVGVGHDDRSILARCTVVNGRGEIVFDRHVRPMKGQIVTNYRTWVSGIRAKDIRYGSDALDFRVAQQAVAEIIKGNIVVGHALKNDFSALMMNHSPLLVRDTAKFKPLLRARKQGSFKIKYRPQKLKKLTAEILGVDIQGGEHDSADDARAALLLYYKFRKEWEASLRRKRKAKKR
eukprot:g1363.t1